MSQALEDLARRTRPLVGRAKRLLVGKFRPPPTTSLDRWAIASDRAPELLAQANLDLQRLVYGNTGRPIHKWTHYLEHYERHMARFRGTSVGMMEIGVYQGGSLALWRKYLGADARIMGVDINPECAGRVDPPNMVRIGSQADPDFLRSSVADLGGPLDIVLDDGSHVGKHQWSSFRTLFPLLSDGGLYIIEDLHTSYWRDFGGGASATASTGIGLVRDLIDDMHAWYHDADESTPAREWVTGIHVYDSMVFIEKNRRTRPGHILVGTLA